MSTTVALLTVLMLGRAAGPLVEVVVARHRVRRLRAPEPARTAELEAITVGNRRLLPQVGRGAGSREAGLVDALDAVGRSLRSGATIPAALQEAAGAVSGPVGGDLARVASRTPVRGAVAALEAWARERPEPGVRLAVAAMVLGIESGGAPARAVDGVAAGLRARQALAAEVKALSSQARLSAVVIAGAPLAFGTLASATDAGIAAFLFGTRIGIALLAAGLLLDALGAWWMVHICRLRPPGAIDDELPEVVELLAVAVRAGLTVRLAVEAVGARAHGILASEFARAVRQCERGALLADALAEVPARVGERSRPLVAALVDADRYGSPLAPALERLAADARDGRRRAAEERARRVPVLLLFPLVLCILPAFGLLTVAPLLAGALDALTL